MRRRRTASPIAVPAPIRLRRAARSRSRAAPSSARSTRMSSHSRAIASSQPHSRCLIHGRRRCGPSAVSRAACVFRSCRRVRARRGAITANPRAAITTRARTSPRCVTAIPAIANCGRTRRTRSTAARDQSARAARGISALRSRGGFDLRQLAAALAHDKENDMSGDYSRVRYAPRTDIAGVLMQQGRVQLDSDWNEWVAVLERRLRAETVDVFGVHAAPGVSGVAVVSPQTPDAFKIDAMGGAITIGRGRMYVDGLLAENHGGGTSEFDPLLTELRGQSAIDYTQQPYFPAPPDKPAGGPHR